MSEFNPVKNFASATPKVWTGVSRSLRFFISGAITTISATDLLPDKKVKAVVLGLGIFGLIIQSIDMGLGVKETPTQEDK